jgi:hypothetical protein
LSFVGVFAWLPGRLSIATVLVAAGSAAPAFAQLLPAEPVSLAGGRITVGGDISATFSCASAGGDGAICADDIGFFNYTDYRHSALRMLLVDVTASLRMSDQLWVLGEVRSENGAVPEPYALYVRFRPWVSRTFDIQVGRIPPTFGAFARRTYAADNLLIGYPLAYQYLTSLRPDALPATADELIRMRGRGWLSSFSIGSRSEDNGLPLVSAFEWDTGVQVHAAGARAEAAVAVTAGTVANPRFSDDNAGKQVVARAALRPVAGLVAGVSAARGPFVAREALRMAGSTRADGDYTQTAWGADLEYSRAYYLVRFEAIVSDWRVPVVGSPEIELPLRAVSTSIEGRYKLRPGLYAAARVDHLGFSEITGSGQRAGWDAPVTRIEVGGGYSVQRNLLLKLAWQHNTRPTTRAATLDAGAVQLVYWF